MARYVYYACDTLTGQLLAELPLADVAFQVIVNDAGTWSATLPATAAPFLARVTNPGRTSIYIERDGVLVYGGIIWGRKYDAAAQAFNLDGLDFLSYLDHLVITSDLNYAQVEQLAIARSIVQYAMGKGGSDLALAYIGSTTSGIKRDRTYAHTDGTMAGDALRQLSAVDQGFDFRFGVRWEAGYPRRFIQFGYPSLGRAIADSKLYFDYQADMSSLTFSEDATSSASTVYATGGVLATAPAGTLPPQYTADDPTVRASGMPRLEDVQSFDDITQIATLTAHAVGQLTVERLPIMTMSAEVGHSTTWLPAVGTYLPGDQAVVAIEPGDPMFPNGASALCTIVSIDVAVSDEGDEDVSLGLAPSYITQYPGVLSAGQRPAVPADEDVRLLLGQGIA